MLASCLGDGSRKGAHKSDRNYRIATLMIKWLRRGCNLSKMAPEVHWELISG